ncbi:MAG: hypothetical protein IPM35_01625 [Myxococcales bacterium]|nr:hypothetical protein [Myxococcales bacterium]
MRTENLSLLISFLALVTACGGDSDSGKSGAGGVSGAGGAVSGGGGAGVADGGPAQVGDPCSSATECPAGGSGTPVCVAEWPGGYCAVEGCADHGHDCPNDPGLGGTATTGGKCVLAPEATCLALCAGNADCRDGYECVGKPDAAGHTSTNVCFPKSSTAGTMSGGGGMSSGGMGNGGGMMDGGM